MSPESQSMGLFARYLTLWVVLRIMGRGRIGARFPSIFHALGGMELAHINLPVAILGIVDSSFKCTTFGSIADNGARITVPGLESRIRAGGCNA